MNSMSERGMRIFSALEQAGENLLTGLQPSPDLYQTAKDRLRIPLPVRTGGYQVGIIGEQSAGKSTFLNGICCYPILPAASVITSDYAVEIRKSSNDYIEILTEKAGETISVDLQNRQFDEVFVLRLLEYALICFQNDIITCDNLNYLTTRRLRKPDNTKVNLELADFDLFDADNPRQVWMLLMILLGAHVGDPLRCDESGIREQIKQQRRKLLTDLGIDSEAPYKILLFWNSDLLSEDTVIMDLPGLRDAAGRSTITQQYMDQVDSVVVLFNPDHPESALYRFLCSFVQLEHAKLTDSTSGRVLAVMNKADTCAGDILPKLQDIREKCAIDPKQPIYPICALGGEYAYVRYGGVDIRSTLVWKQMELPSSEAEVLEELRRGYERSYPYREEEGALITLSQVHEKITRGCAQRLGCLSLLIAADRILEGLALIKSDLTLRRSLRIFLRKSSRPITKQLNEALTETCAQALNAFCREFRETMDKVAERMKSYERLEAAKELYRQELDRLEGDIDRTLEAHVRKMKRSLFKIKLSNEANQIVFDDLMAWLSGDPTADGSRLVISDYLKKGNTKLELTLGYQKLKYAEGIADLAACCRRFPAIFSDTWDVTYARIREELLDGKEELSEDDLAIYDEQAAILKESACEFIARMARERIRLLRADTSMEAEFAVTSGSLRSYMEELERFYYRECPKMLRSCRKEFLLSRDPYLTPKALKALFRDKSYASQAKQAFISELDRLLTADSTANANARTGPIPVRLALKIFSELYRRFGKNRPHQERVKETLAKLSRKFRAGTEKDLQEFSGQIKKEIKSLMDDGKSSYNTEIQMLDAHLAQYHEAISTLRSEILTPLEALSRTEELGSDADYLLKKLAKL